MPGDLPSLSPIPRVADSVAAAFPLNRVVVLATPVLASLAAVIGGWLVDKLSLKSTHVDQAMRRSLMLAASASATAMAYKWLEGWQEHAEQEFRIENGLIATGSGPIRGESISALEELGLEAGAASTAVETDLQLDTRSETSDDDADHPGRDE